MLSRPMLADVDSRLKEWRAFRKHPAKTAAFGGVGTGGEGGTGGVRGGGGGDGGIGGGDAALVYPASIASSLVSPASSPRVPTTLDKAVSSKATPSVSPKA